MKIKVSEASGPVLDWMVEFAMLADRVPNTSQRASIASRNRRVSEVGYSTDWSAGGPIIEREEIGTERRAPCMKGEEWEASGSITAKGAGYRYAVGPTPLIAAMRCYVVSKLGDEVEVPEELL